MNSVAVGAAVVLAVVGGNETLNRVKQMDTKKSDYRTVDTRSFTIQVPDGWSVSEETPWGSREIRPNADAKVVSAASMSSMTGPGLGKQSWDRLYDTSLYFITRYDRQVSMKATPYTLGKSKQGFEMCTWNMTDADGNILQRHTILKHTNGNILALSVKVPVGAGKDDRAHLDRMFQHMVDTAKVK